MRPCFLFDEIPRSFGHVMRPLVAGLGVHPNLRYVLSGDGTYSFQAAEKDGPSGRVYVTEIDQEKLKILRAEVAKRKLYNIIIVDSAANDTKLPSSCCDAIFLRHVYHHLTQPKDFDRNLVRSLKPGGQLAVIDFPPSPNSELVEGVPKNWGGHGIPEKVMVEELTSVGLQVEKVINDWSQRNYCVIFMKRQDSGIRCLL